MLGPKLIEDLQNYYSRSRVKGDVLAKLILYYKKRKETPEPGLRPSATNVQKRPAGKGAGGRGAQGPSGQKSQDMEYTIPKKSSGSHPQGFDERLQEETATLGKRELAERPADAVSAQPQKAVVSSGSNNHKLLSIVSSELHSPKDGPGLFFLQFHRLFERRVGQKIEKPVVDYQFLKRYAQLTQQRQSSHQ